MFQNIQQLAQKGTYETVLMWFVIWHNEESRGHNVETNKLLITAMLQFHVQRRSSLNSGP